MGVNEKGYAMFSRVAKISALTLALLAGCSAQMTDVSRQIAGGASGFVGNAATIAEPARVMTVSASNIGVIAAHTGTGYLVGRGDILQIHAIDAPELTLPAGYVVESDGAIQVPFLGRVPAADRDTVSIRADITQRLRSYLPQPQIELRVIAYNSSHIQVIGDVNRPNRQTLTSQPLSVIDAINAAGGFAQGANMRRVAILREGREIAVDMEGFLTTGAALPYLRNGDLVQVGRAAPSARANTPAGVTLHVPDRPERQFVLGHQTVSLAQLVASASMDDADAQLRRGSTVYHFSADDARDPAVGGRMTLERGDVVVLASRSAAPF